MRLIVAALSSAALAISAPVYSQSNDDDYTPLNSRIKRSKQFPLQNFKPYNEGQLTAVNRARNRDLLNKFSKCVYRRSREKSLDLLSKTDLGFVNFNQYGLDSSKASRVFGFKDCLGRVATSNRTGLRLSFSAGGLRQWLLREAYFDNYKDDPAWIKPGHTVGSREYPLSENNNGIRVTAELGDCVVLNDPYNSDFFYRTLAESEEEGAAMANLKPALDECYPGGGPSRIDPSTLRILMGEALWHAANNTIPAETELQQEVAE